jgi:phosphate transport system permease protein
MDWRKARDYLTGLFMRLTAFFAISLVFFIALCLLIRSWPILSEKTLAHLLLSTSWHPLKGEFGFLPFITGTLEVTALAMIISVPICLLSAI